MFGPDDHLPSLRHNGALDPSRWRPSYDNLRDMSDRTRGAYRVEEGDVVGLRYAAWIVHEVRPYLDVDLTDDQRARLQAEVADFPEKHRAEQFERRRPFHVVLRHQRGPLPLRDGESPFWKVLHDGTKEVSFTSWPTRTAWYRLADPYKTCSCHGHPWPCQDYDRQVLTAYQIRDMDKKLATAQPGVCAACLEPISSRQKTLTFPEESRFVPGAPGPTFHAGRGECWGAAEKYEREGRLADNPDVVRLASCPGVRFIHEQLGMPTDRRIDCTAGPLCTGHHGPAGYRNDTPCWMRVDLADAEGAYARPSFDCGYRSGDRACIGGDLSSGGTTLSPTAADTLWRQRSHGGFRV